jgi:hypothetical protein
MNNKILFALLLKDHFANNVFPASDAGRLNIAYTASYGVSSLVFGHFLDSSVSFFIHSILILALLVLTNFANIYSGGEIGVFYVRLRM